MGSCSSKRSQKPSLANEPIQIRRIKELTPITGEHNHIFNFSCSRSSISSLLSSTFEAYGEYPSKFDQPFAVKPVNFKNSDSPNLLLKHKIAVSCHKGMKTGQNQDNFTIVSTPSACFVGVFDGHGENGHEISSIAHKSLIKNLLQTTNLDYKSAFIQTNKQIFEKCEKKHIDYSHSGSTGTLIAIHPDKLTISHIGDSRAMLIKNYQNIFISVPLTIDHNLKDSLETTRVLEMGGHIVKRFKNDVKRIYVPGDEMGLTVTRAFGDSEFNKVGIICEPCVRDLQFDGTEEYLIVASDGIWDVIEGWEFAEALKTGTTKEVCEKFAKLAWDRWIQATNDIVDDITLIIVPFNEQD